MVLSQFLTKTKKCDKQNLAAVETTKEVEEEEDVPYVEKSVVCSACGNIVSSGLIWFLSDPGSN